MFTKNQKSVMVRFILLLVLTVGMVGVVPVEAAGTSGATPQVQITTPSYPVGMDAGENKLVTYSLKETANVSGEFTSRSIQFFTQYDVPLSELMGPYPTKIQINALSSMNWNEPVYLPESVVSKARSMNKYALVLKTTFSGTSTTGTKFSAESSLLLLLRPDTFSKASPADGAIVSPDNLSLQWNSSTGAIDYEYCFDTSNNDSCDTSWVGTYWLGTYDTFAALRSLPNRTFYWQVRATNLAGRAYADNGKWWSFNICDNPAAVLITVANTNDSGPGSLRQAIKDVCTGGTITFAPQLSGKTITLESTLQVDRNLTINGAALTSKVSVSGNNTVTVFRIASGVSVTLDNLIITNGNAPEAYYGGDYLGVVGGGIKNYGFLTITNSLITSNIADMALYGNGGAIYNRGDVTITNSTISNNSAGVGGGIMNMGNMLITNSTIALNDAVEGGGIYNMGVLNLTGSTVSRNVARGGGIISTGVVTVMNSTFFGNSSTAEGGGILNYGPLSVVNSTFSDNSAVTNGGGIYNGNGPLNLTNTILANSPSGIDCYNDTNVNGMMGIDIDNLIETNAASPYQCGVPAITRDPKLDTLSYNDGLTNTMALLPGSPAIDAGSDTNCPATDQRGIKRPQGAHCDIGAYEYPVIVLRHPVIRSKALLPQSLTIQSGITVGSLSSLSLLDQTGTDDNPDAYDSFQTPNDLYRGYQSFSLPEETQAKLISTMLLQLNVKAPASSTQVWTWSIYDWTSNLWIKVGDTTGLGADQWQELVFRIRQPWKYVSSGNEIRIQLTSNNANGDLKIDYEALHVTYLFRPALPTSTSLPITPNRPGIFSVPMSTPKP